VTDGSRTYDTRGRQAAAERNRAAVVDACRHLVLRDGYRATTVKAVAQRAGVSPELVYKVFGGKKQVMKAVYDVTLAGDHEPTGMADRPELRDVLAATDLDEALTRYAAFVLGVHQRLSVLTTVLAEADPDLADLAATADAERLTGVTAFVGHLADKGLLAPDVDLAESADACWLLTSSTVFVQATRSREWTDDRYRDWLIRMLHGNLPAAQPRRRRSPKS